MLDVCRFFKTTWQSSTLFEKRLPLDLQPYSDLGIAIASRIVDRTQLQTLARAFNSFTSWTTNTLSAYFTGGCDLRKKRFFYQAFEARGREVVPRLRYKVNEAIRSHSMLVLARAHSNVTTIQPNQSSKNTQAVRGYRTPSNDHQISSMII